MRRTDLARMVACVGMVLLLLGVLAQVCLAEEAQVRQVVENLCFALANRDVALLDEVWSHEDDVRWTWFLPPNVLFPPEGYNVDLRGWDMVKQSLLRNAAGHLLTLDRVDVETFGGVATVRSHWSLRGLSDKGIMLLRKEDDNWRFYVWDMTGVIADRTGDEGGQYVGIAFEAEHGVAADGSIFQGDTASGGKYIMDFNDPVRYEFSVPEAGEYTIWGRTLSLGHNTDSLFAQIDGSGGKGWDTAQSSRWAWCQVNQKGIKGPFVVELEEGQHTATFWKREQGTKLDALYITNNLSLRSDQIQQRFDLAMGYTQEANPVSAKAKLATTWAGVKRHGK